MAATPTSMGAYLCTRATPRRTDTILHSRNRSLERPRPRHTCRQASRSGGQGHVRRAERARIDAKARLVQDLDQGAIADRIIVTLSAMPNERHPVCIRKAREEKSSQWECQWSRRGQYLMMQSQMIGMQSSLDRILSAIQSQNAAQVYPHSAIPPTPQSASTHPSMSESPREGVAFTPQPVVPSSSRDGYYDDDRSPPRKKWPALPGFAPPPHKFATYGIVPSTAPSSEDESEDTLPRSALNAPIEALQGLANAAVEAATGPGLSPRLGSRDAYNRVKKRKRVEPIPRNAFPNVLEKLQSRFFSGCHLFIPLFDPAYDTFESLRDRTPFCFDAILAVAAKIRVGNGQPGATFHRCLEEAQGIARSTLFGPVVRKEAVQAMLLLSAWSTNGWLPSGHAMRMALDLGLHRALEKLADGPSEGKRSEAEERDLGGLGTGHPIILRDESSIRHCRLLLSHPMASPTDQLGPTMDEDSLLRKILSGELYYAKLWLVCVALRGVSWDKMPFEQRELAFQAKEAASNCLATFLNSPAYRAALRYAVHDSLVTAAFSGLFLLKVANLFPGEVDLAGIVVQVDQLANLLSEVAAERYALTLRVMLTNLRRKIGLTTPALQPGDGIDVSAVTSATPGVTGFDPTAPTSATGLTGMGILDDMAFSWPADSMFSPSNIPLWLQEAIHPAPHIPLHLDYLLITGLARVRYRVSPIWVYPSMDPMAYSCPSARGGPGLERWGCPRLGSPGTLCDHSMNRLEHQLSTPLFDHD
ncbi:hypothetical protein AG1IA_03330 [Rhizoctonia solani AG-1 IA]|uniref:Fungal specific transcription factor domain-containing protein n=1 Tax=Thanatephorus cucumeris (strain AG1-IA) TaxID=983506 RepID=L8WWY5_THACA|nr:hypothetical protein AG1IA_03330 [Rhizoctonia solani AG-1 IA]